MSEKLLRAEDLGKHFQRRGLGRWRRAGVRAVADVSFDIERGETLGLVGESGCGKSTLARLVLNLIPPDNGRVVLDDEDFTHAPRGPQRRLRRRMQIVFQDALSSLNPRMTVGVNIAEPLRLQNMGNAAMQREAARDMLDEAVSALDVSIRAQILRLILDLQQQRHLSYLFISHDLGVVRRVSDRIAVMYLGRVVEVGTAPEVCRAPLHPYARALLSAIPLPDPRRMRVRDLGLTEGEAASPLAPPSGCSFHDRCFHRLARCATERPLLVDVAPNRAVACFLHHATAASPDG
jgi:oligopeptide/dipeptide ABC transporter ATP-binding protein